MEIKVKHSNILIIIGASIIIIGTIIFFWNNFYLDKNSTINGQLLEQYGTFIAGTVGSLWALAGVILFYVALKEQRKDFKINSDTLKLQQEELTLTRKELQGQRKEFEIQNATLKQQHETLKHQQFENTFFSLLDIQHDIRSSIEFKQSNILHTGAAFFNFAYEDLRVKYGHTKNEYSQYLINNNNLLRLTHNYNIEANNIIDITLPQFRSKAAYIHLHKSYNQQLEHYFKNLHTTLKYLYKHENLELVKLHLASHKEEITDDEYQAHEESIHTKYLEYADFLRAQMSNAELTLLFYNACFYHSMKKIMYHFDFFKEFNSDDLLDPINDINLYAGEFIDGDTYNAITLQRRTDVMKL